MDSDYPTVTSLRPTCDSLYSEEVALPYQDRIVISPSPRCRGLQSLHAAHRETSTMEQRTRAIVSGYQC